MAFVLFASFVSAVAEAQTTAVADLKAAFLFNFAKFAVWPADAVPVGAPLTFCIIGDWFVAQSLETAVQGKALDGHSLVVTRVKSDAVLRSCQILYAGRVDKRRALELLDAVDGVAVLTVSDLETFTQIGGTAAFFGDQNRMRFTVNMDSVRRSRVQLSAQMLRLATLVTSK